MVIYIALYLFLILIAMVEMLSQNKRWSFITAGTLALFAGLRFFTGFDFISYGNFYRDMDGIADVFNGSIDAETGYLFLTFVFKRMGLNYPTFILFFSILSLGLLFYYLYKNVDYPSLILIYYVARFYFARDMGQIRGAIASIILLFAIPYIKKKNFGKFLLIVTLASLFHVSAFIFILGYVAAILFQKITFKKSVMLLLVSVMIGAVANVPQLYLWLIPGRYNAYFTGASYTNGAWLMNPVLWMQLMIYFGALIFTRIAQDEKYATYLLLYFLSSFILIAAGNLSTIGGRMSGPFTTQEIFVAPYLLLNFSRNKLLNVFLYLGFTTGIFILIFIISGIYIDYIPYQTIFN